MFWITAIALARSCEVNYIEWCNLYYDSTGPTEYQLRLCEVTAHEVLVRNNIIENNVKFIYRPMAGQPMKMQKV